MYNKDAFKNSVNLSNYETLNLNIIENSLQKLIASAELYKTGYAFTSSFFLSVIAEEELAKLIMLPIAKELDEVDKLLNSANRFNSGYYNHTIKQKIFTSYGLQNRGYKKIQKLKEKCLYVTADDELTSIAARVSPEETYKEIVLAFTLFTDFIQKIIAGSKIIEEKTKKKYFTDKFVKIVVFLIGILKGFVNDKIPEIKQDILKIIEKRDNQIKKQLDKCDPRYRKTVLLPYVLSNPYALIDFFKSLYGETEYKNHLRNIQNKSYAGIKNYIIKSAARWCNDEKKEK